MKITHLFYLFLITIQSCTSQTDNQINKKEALNELGMIIEIDSKDSFAIKGVKTIPQHTFDKVDLKYLSILGQDCDIAGVECFAISEIPKEINRLKNLEELHLTLNYLKNFL